VINAKAANPIYGDGYWSMGDDTLQEYKNEFRVIHGDINHLVNGNIIELLEHWAFVRSIEYSHWMVQNTQTLRDFSADGLILA